MLLRTKYSEIFGRTITEVLKSHKTSHHGKVWSLLAESRIPDGCFYFLYEGVLGSISFVSANLKFEFFFFFALPCYLETVFYICVRLVLDMELRIPMSDAF